MAQERTLPGSDIPAELSVSSIGAIEWPPVSATEQRKKGIYPCVITNPTELYQIVRAFQCMPLDEDTTRISGRLFVERDLVKHAGINERLNLQTSLEAIVPLTGVGVSDLEDCVLLYLGKNAQTRKTIRTQIVQELQDATAIYSQPLPDTTHDFTEYSFCHVDDALRADPNVQRQYFELYRAFGWSEDDVIKLITNPHNLLIAAFKGDELVSAGMGEFGAMHLTRDGMPIDFRVCEITEAATKEEYRGNGLYTQVGIELMKTLAQTDVNLVYAESNLRAPGVLKAGKRQGRRSVLDSFATYGYPTRVLEQHVRIVGGAYDTRPVTERNDLLVTFMTQSDLLKTYGNQ